MKRRMKISRLLLAVLTVATLGAATSNAYVDMELDGNRHVIGEYYSAEGDKLVVYRPSGAIEVDRATVRSIQERSGEMPAEVHAVSSGAATSSAPPSSGAPSGAVGTTPEKPVKDPQSREQELGRELIQMRLNRLAAKQRGDEEAIKQFDKEIKTRQAERESNWKKLEPTSADGGSGD
jgi:hypothetical protein